MKAWMLSVGNRVHSWLGLLGPRRDLGPTQRSAKAASARRARSWSARSNPCDALEGRALLSASGLSDFAILPGQVTSANQPSQVVLHLNPGELRADQTSTVVVGFVVEAADGSSISPEITRATGPNGPITPISIPNRGNSPVDKAARQTHLFTRVIPLANQSQDITLNVATLNKKTGNYIVEAFLAGDVNGDGTVDSSDLNALQLAYGSRASQVNYNPAADFNGDGRVGRIDQALLLGNIGAHVVATTQPASTTTATPSPIVPLAAASTEVNLVPQADPPALATSVPVATPAAVATPNSVPVSITPTGTIPVASTSVGTSVVLTPVYASSGTAGSGSIASTTPIYMIAQPVGTVGTAAPSAASAPIYLYGQPVATGTSTSTPSGSPASALFGQTSSGPSTTSTTPVPIYLYDTPNYSPMTPAPQVLTTPSSSRSGS